MKDTKLDRRNFLKTTAVGAAGLTLLANSAANADSDPMLRVPESLSTRRIIPLNHDWLYSEKTSPEATQTNFNDKAFARVTIPHTNKMLPASGFDEHEYMFVSVYRRHFRLPRELKGQRIFVDFGGVMTAAKVYINGKNLGEYRGGYMPFSFELTGDINWTGDNALAVEVDSTERADIPPFGNLVDYLTFGGIYRDVSIRAVNPIHINNVFAKPINVLQDNRAVDVDVEISGFVSGKKITRIRAELFDGNLSMMSKEWINPAPGLSLSPSVQMYKTVKILLEHLSSVTLWDISNPKLYMVRVTLFDEDKVVDHYETRIGFREAKFTENGFFLNGKHLKLRGLDRHQTYPYVGQAMPARGQRRDAWILRKELKCNIVRTSHYPQSPHFLDACDELGLLVFEEIPGWQHIGDQAWKDLATQHVGEMIRRDWNHPSIILWGVRINESGDDHDFYTKTNALAHQLDDSRPTGGVRYRYNSERLEDVFTMNDFGFPLRPPNHPLYLNTEFSGHMYPTKQSDNIERVREHTHRHARVHDALAASDKYAGGIGWCAFDYNTHANFGSGDRICYHGVTDIYRIPKPAAGFYRSQCDPSEEIVLEPAFHWAVGDENEAFTYGLVSSNCEKLRYFVGDKLVAEAEPDRKTYPNLKYAPFNPNLRSAIWGTVKWDDLRIEGWIGGKKVIERTMSGKGVDRQFVIKADDAEINADGIDMTRVVFKVTDEFGNDRPFAQGAIQFTIENGEIIGDNPFALVGGCGAVWIRSRRSPGTIRLTAKHARFGTKTLEIKTVATPASLI